MVRHLRDWVVSPTLAGLEKLTGRLSEHPGALVVAEPTGMSWLSLGHAVNDAECGFAPIGSSVRPMLLLAGFVVGSAVVLIGVVRDSLAMVALGGLLAVPTGAALKQELSNERYAGVIHQGRGRLQQFVGHLRGRGPMASVGGVAGLIVGELMLGWWWDLGLPVQCQDLFLPDPLVCGIHGWVGGTRLAGTLALHNTSRLSHVGAGADHMRERRRRSRSTRSEAKSPASESHPLSA